VLAESACYELVELKERRRDWNQHAYQKSFWRSGIASTKITGAFFQIHTRKPAPILRTYFLITYEESRNALDNNSR